MFRALAAAQSRLEFWSPIRAAAKFLSFLILLYELRHNFPTFLICAILYSYLKRLGFVARFRLITKGIPLLVGDF